MCLSCLNPPPSAPLRRYAIHPMEARPGRLACGCLLPQGPPLAVPLSRETTHAAAWTILPLGTTSSAIPPRQVNPRRIYMNFTVARWNIPLSVRGNPRVSQIDMDLPVITAPSSTDPSKFRGEEAYLPIQEAYRFFSSKRRGPGSIPSSGCNIFFFW